VAIRPRGLRRNTRPRSFTRTSPLTTLLVADDGVVLERAVAVGQRFFEHGLAPRFGVFGCSQLLLYRL
jgi:hypothetical protein